MDGVSSHMGQEGFWRGGALMKTFSAYVEWDPEAKLYVLVVPGIPVAHSERRMLVSFTRI
jgi:hypothetical protein